MSSWGLEVPRFGQRSKVTKEKTLAIEKLEPSDEQESSWDQMLGTAAQVLFTRGHTEAAFLLLDKVKRATFVWMNSWGDFEHFHHYYEVDASSLDDLTEDMEAQIVDVMDKIGMMDREGCSGVTLVPAKVQGDWRSELRAAMTGKPVNQATLAALPNEYPIQDKMRFRDRAELLVYEGLKRSQAKLPHTDTIAIAPNASLRVQGHTFEPDFLVAYLGKSGVVEVDGNSHRNRWAADKTKDSLYEDAGIAYISRINVEDTKNPAEVDAFIERFLTRLRG